jgi:glycosyltransferase involved in cell wall biosynthesis
LFRRADRLLVYSQFEGDHFRSLAYRVPIDVVGSAIEDRADGNAERFRQQTGIAGQMILYIGRKDPDKGYPLMIEAFHRLRSRMPDVNLVCIGPPGAERLRGAEIGLLDLGFVSEQTKHERSPRGHALCVPSVESPSGLVYGGRPICQAGGSSALASAEELLENGRAGLLIRDHRTQNRMPWI